MLISEMKHAFADTKGRRFAVLVVRESSPCDRTPPVVLAGPKAAAVAVEIPRRENSLRDRLTQMLSFTCKLEVATSAHAHAD